MFLKKRWSLLLLKHRRQTAKFQFIEQTAAEEKLTFFSVLPPQVDLFTCLWQKKALARASAFFSEICPSGK